MNMNGTATWIAEPRFAGRTPLQLLGKELDKSKPEHEHELRNFHMLVRKRVAVPAGISGAVLRISADDYYKLYINGEFVGQGPAQGFHDRYFYNEYDVSGWLRFGEENIIAVHVYYQGLVNRVFNSGDYRQGMIAELLTPEGEVLAATDSSWKIRQAMEFGGPDAATFGYDTQFVEDIDNRRKLSGWRAADFDDSAWQPAVECPADDHVLIPQETPVVQVYTRRPVLVERRGEGHYWMDFGEELTGQFTMKASGRAGDRIEIRCGEELMDNERDVRHQLRCNCNYLDTWTLSGEPDEELEGYDYKAFRYVEVLGPGEALAPDSFAMLVRHYPWPDDAAEFQSSDATLEGVWGICSQAVKIATQEHYMDCPTREKGQYLGDNTITALSHLYLTGDLRGYRKQLEDFAATTRICPGLMAVAPGHLMQEIADYSLQWPMQLLEYYRHSGDLAFLGRMVPAAEGIMAHFASYERAEDGLLERVADKWNLVDWPANQRDGYDFPLTKPIGEGVHNVVNAFYYGAMLAMEEIRDILGQPSQGEKASAFRSAFQRAFWRPDHNLYADAEHTDHSSLHGNTLPLLFGLVPDAGRAKVISFLKEKRLVCGVYFAYFYMKALAKAGEREFVYSLMVTEEPHELQGPKEKVTVRGYWANMRLEGATTCYESWSKHLKWNTSLCHPWASSPISVLIEDIIGLAPGKPGWAEIRFNPLESAVLPDLALAIPTLAGRIRAKREQGRWSYELERAEAAQ